LSYGISGCYGKPAYLSDRFGHYTEQLDIFSHLVLEATQQCWQQMWETKRAPEACYMYGIIGSANIVANSDDQLTLY